MPHFQPYLWRVVLTFLLGALAAIAFVFIVDPYGLYGVVDRRGFNQLKPYPDRYLAEIRIARATARNANALILGNSRAEIGFDPEHQGFKRAGLRAHNLAAPGGDVEQYLVVLQRLRARGINAQALLAGIDFMDFAGSAARETQVTPALAGEWRWRFDTLFSLASVLDAGATLRIQHAAEVATISAAGLAAPRDYDAIARRDGYYAMFRQRAEENVRQYLWWQQRLSDERLVGSSQFRALREFIRMAARERVALDLVIYPYHAQLYALYQESGVWPSFERWKDAVASEAAAARAQYPGADISVWDFSGFAGPRCERIPERGDRKTVTRWYWEGGHFKKALGDIMLDQILLDRARPEIAGTLLVPEALQQNRQRLAAERAACLDDNAELFAEARAMVEQARQTLVRTASVRR